MRKLSYLMMSLTLAGCATIMSGTTQSVFLDTFNAPGATCKGIDKKGREYFWVNTPSATTVQKGDGPMTIACEKTGFKKSFHTIDETIVGSTFGNIILGGGIGIFVDAASGAAQEYPTLVRFPLEPVESASPEVKEAYNKAKQDMVKEKSGEK